ncbi:MAG: integration host factor subunit beta [Anaerolineaceae bacterium]|nr:integration host factor subunit beta [Anaerolineaceae bacterium]
MQTITKKQLTDRIADRTGQKRVLVKQVIQMFLNDIVDELAAGNRLEFRDFGVFETRRRKPRIAQNPRTLERVHVPVKWTVKFKVGRLMKQKVQDAVEPGGGQAAGQAVQSIAAEGNPDGGSTSV